MKKVIGIDLGSTQSEIAIIENGKPKVVANEDGSYMTPSVVSFIDGERKVGSAAKRQQVVRPKETVYLIKRFMGSTYDECSDAIKHVQYDVVDENGMPRVKIDGRLFSPEEISSHIVGKMKRLLRIILEKRLRMQLLQFLRFLGTRQEQPQRLLENSLD